MHIVGSGEDQSITLEVVIRNVNYSISVNSFPVGRKKLHTLVQRVPT